MAFLELLQKEYENEYGLIEFREALEFVTEDYNPPSGKYHMTQKEILDYAAMVCELEQMDF